MKRLIRKSDQWTPKINDNVRWKRHPYDNSVYTVTEILPNGNLFIDNGISAYTDIKPSTVEPA